jgi:phosphoribosylaminoimidazole-succinocarboxamide synthase
MLQLELKGGVMAMGQAMFESSIPGLPKPKRGKVRDVYNLGDRLLLVATDRISAFDVVFPTPIPDKGRILTGLTLMWLDLLKDIVPNHLISGSLSSLNLPAEQEHELTGRALLVKKARVIPFECIVRGYIAGGGWKEYKTDGTVCGVGLPPGLKMADKLPEPIFTPSTKEETGHDRNVPFQTMVDELGRELVETVRDAALELYNRAAAHALGKGIVIADTKFEFGIHDHEVMLIDEVLTPDSSRFWPAAQWEPGKNPPSFDKQYLRDWLENECCWNKEPPPPSLPDRVVEATRKRYLEAYVKLTGHNLR